MCNIDILLVLNHRTFKYEKKLNWHDLIAKNEGSKQNEKLKKKFCVSSANKMKFFRFDFFSILPN